MMPEHLFARLGEETPEWLGAGGMLRRIQAFDWSRSSAGPLEAWPEDLRSAVRLILLSSSAMAVLIGREGIVVPNDALLDMLGAPEGRVLGQPIAHALPMAAGFFGAAIAVCYGGKGVRFSDHPLGLLRNGVLETAWLSLSFTPIADIRGDIHGVLVIAKETTDRVQALRALAQSRQRLELALEAGGMVGIWDLDVRSNRVTTNDTLARLFGVREEEARHGVSTDVLATSVHPHDRDRVLETLRAAIETGSDYRCRYRLVTGTGDIRWFVASGRPLRDEGGQVAQFAGIVIDITEQTETVAALEQSNLRFDILAESVPQIIWSTDTEGRHDYFNRRWTEFTGIAPEQNEPTTWQELVHPDDWPRVTATWQECMATGKTYDITYRFRYRDGSYRWLWVRALPLRDREGRITRWYGTSSDIDASKQLEEQRELVSRELDHRIKNLFALVNGLVSLSTREQPEHRPLADALRARLDALNRAHALIRPGPDTKVGSLRSLLQQLLDPYADGNAGRIVIAGPDADVDAGAVTSIALVFHELITNAAKYGALSRTDGTLRITLRPDGERQVIEWQERFEEGATGEAGEGFGSRLLKTMVEGPLRGTITRDLSPTGLATHIDIPRSALSAAARPGDA